MAGSVVDLEFSTTNEKGRWNQFMYAFDMIYMSKGEGIQTKLAGDW